MPEFPYQISPQYERFNPKYQIFSRVEWDEKVGKMREKLLPGRVRRIASGDEGHGLLDYAMRSAGWYLVSVNNQIASSMGGRNLYSSQGVSHPHSTVAAEPWSRSPELEKARQELKARMEPQFLSKAVKKAARFLGAELVGLAPYDERWVYSHLYRRGFEEGPKELVLEMPKDVSTVVVLAFEMDREALDTSPTALAAAATGLGYSRMAFTTSSLAEFIRDLGYWAKPCGNDTALSVPLAVAAGLGEAGRHGLLITKDYGSRVRLSKIFTNMLLVTDEPVSFGAWEFCKVCKKCAEQCPPRAISFDDEPSWEGATISNNPGVLKWYVHVEKCYRFWCQNGGSCSNCQTSCPYNKDYSHWYHRLIRDIAPRLGRLAVWSDDLLGYGKQTLAKEWWTS